MDKIAVSMPYRGCPDRLDRAIRSILMQTHKDITLFVIGDGEKPETKIEDPRLRVYTLEERNGPYFCHALVQRLAADHKWFAPHDADDYSELDRYARLLKRCSDRPEAGAAFSSVTRHHIDGRVDVRRPITSPINAKLFHRASHCGIIKMERLLGVGGYHPDFLVSWDTMVVSLLMMTGPVKFVGEPSYHYHFRSNGLTQSEDTRLGSEIRSEAHRVRQTIYNRCFKLYRANRPELIADEVVKTISPVTLRRLDDYHRKFS